MTANTSKETFLTTTSMDSAEKLEGEGEEEEEEEEDEGKEKDEEEEGGEEDEEEKEGSALAPLVDKEKEKKRNRSDNKKGQGYPFKEEGQAPAKSPFTQIPSRKGSTKMKGAKKDKADSPRDNEGCG